VDEIPSRPVNATIAPAYLPDVRTSRLMEAPELQAPFGEDILGNFRGGSVRSIADPPSDSSA